MSYLLTDDGKLLIAGGTDGILLAEPPPPGDDYPGNPIPDEDDVYILDEDDLPIEDEDPLIAPSPGVLGTQWVIYVRDTANRRVAQLDSYTNATMVLRFNAVGDWQLTAPYTDAAVKLASPKYGIEFVRDGQVIFTGPVTVRTRVFGDGVDGYEFQGRCDNVHLSWRNVSPQPASAGPPYDGDAYDVRTGAASQVIQAYVNVNAGPGAVLERRTGITVPSVGTFGSTVTGRGRWQNLLPFVAELGAAGGVGFRVLRMQFTVYQPVDRSAQVKFSVPLGNVAAFSYSDAAPDTNHVVVAGGGEGTARVVREHTDTGSVGEWGRIESFVDRRDTTDTDELDQTGQATLTESATKRGFSITPIETESIRFGETYMLGDLVTVITDGVPVVDVVREVIITLDDRGETVTPTVGDPEASPERPSIFAAVKQLTRQVRNLQRS